MNRGQLALPPPRETLLAMPVGQLFVEKMARGFWREYHLQLTRALIYETSLCAAEKAPGRWEALRGRAHFAQRVMHYLKCPSSVAKLRQRSAA